MKREKFASLKQKIICIPIIMMTLISFIIPNYAHASIGEDVLEALQNVILFFADSIIVGIERMMVPESANKTKSEIIQKGTAKEAYLNWYKQREESGDNSWWDDFDLGVASIPIVGDIGFGIKNFLWGIPGGHKSFSGEVEYSNITYSPLLIFSNKVPALNANFFKNYSKKEQDYSIAYQLRNVIATWYVALRNIALVIMLLVLVWIGIKITISSVSSEKAKYKQLLIDWLVAICLLVFLHYIMVFLVNIVDQLTKMIAPPVDNIDFINIARMNASLIVSDDNTMTDKLFNTLIYVTLIIYSLIFTWQYLKRIVKLAFLTLFAPIIAASYPIDKMTDGQAQGYNKWLKDYIYELCVQPLHLILYIVLISSVSALAGTNKLYSLVALGSLMYIEKILRDYLGFEKGHVKPPNPGGLLAAATVGKKAMDMLLPNSNVKNKSGKDGGNSSEPNEKPINTRGDSGYSLLDGGNEDGDQEKGNVREALPEGGFDKDNTKEDGEKGFGKGPISDDPELWKQFKRDDTKGLGNGPISDDPEAWKQFKRDDTKGFGEGPLSDDQKLWDNFKNNGKELNIPKRRIKKPSDLRAKVAATARKASNSKFGKGAKAVAKKYGGNFKRKLTGGKSGIRGLAHAVAGAAKIGAGIAGAATLATTGVAMGIAMGDVSKVAQLGIGGLATGYLGGSKVAGLGTGLISKGYDAAAGVGSTFMSAYDPAGYDKKLQEKEQKRIVSSIRDNDAAMRMFRMKNENMSDKDITAGINECVSQGIDSPEDMQTVFDLENKAGIDRQTAMGAVKISKNVDASTLRDDKKTEQFRKSIENNLSGSDAERKSYEAIDMLRKIHKVDPMAGTRSSYDEAMARQAEAEKKQREAEIRSKQKQAKQRNEEAQMRLKRKRKQEAAQKRQQEKKSKMEGSRNDKQKGPGNGPTRRRPRMK